MRLGCIACVVASACGRVGFDEVAPTGDAVVPPAPIAWWHLDEGTGMDAFDAIAGADATLIGMTTSPTWGQGHAGGALVFAGNGDEAIASRHPRFDNLAALTVDGWIRPTTVTGGTLACFVDKGEPTSGWVVQVGAVGDGDFGFSGLQPIRALNVTSVAGAIQVGVWSHVAVTWDGSTSSAGVHLYVDGIETAYASQTDAAGPRPDDAANPFSINCNAMTGLAGEIDEVRVFDRALSPAEVAAL